MIGESLRGRSDRCIHGEIVEEYEFVIGRVECAAYSATQRQLISVIYRGPTLRITCS